jgi:hypothetical protein
MNLYLVSQDDNVGYDVYDSFVVAAPDEETARNMHPSGDIINWADNTELLRWGTWATKPESVRVEKIGAAVDSMEQGVICASFNAD